MHTCAPGLIARLVTYCAPGGSRGTITASKVISRRTTFDPVWVQLLNHLYRGFQRLLFHSVENERSFSSGHIQRGYYRRPNVSSIVYVIPPHTLVVEKQKWDSRWGKTRVGIDTSQTNPVLSGSSQNLACGMSIPYISRPPRSNPNCPVL